MLHTNWNLNYFSKPFVIYKKRKKRRLLPELEMKADTVPSSGGGGTC